MKKTNNTCELGKVLKMLRNINDLKITEVAQNVDACQPHISRIEQGTKVPSRELLERLGNLYLIDADKIIEFVQNSTQKNLNRYETLRMILRYYIFENPKTAEDVPKCLEKYR